MSTSDELPIRGFLPEITRYAKEDRALVLTAEPGAGKTSLVPQALAQALGGKVLVMEPRRVAAVSAAARVAELWEKKLGDTVGYRVRGESHSSPRALVEAVTPGVLLRMIQSDPGLEGCACVILDEFHERSAQADLAFALLRQARELRPELCLVAMSATMDTRKAAQALRAATLEVPGRTYPIETRYAPLSQGRGFDEAIARLAFDTLCDIDGDALVFMPGQAEINRAAAKFSRLAAGRGLEAVALHGSLSLEAQRRVLNPTDGAPRRAIFATSIAETSLTVPRVTAVVDSGLARLERFQPRTGLNRLVTERESRDRADQRRGRAGRLGPGLCVRAWPEAEALIERAEPELSRAELSGLVLEAAIWGAPKRLDLDWLDPPPEGAWAAGTELLIELGAIERDLSVSRFGSRMATLGTEPRLAALVLRGAEEGCGWTACLAAALLSERASSGSNDIAERIADGGALPQTARTEAERLARAAGIAAHAPERGERVDASRLGSLMAAAFPDRIGERVDFAAGIARYRIPAGRMLSVSGELALSPWIVALEADSGAAEGRIYSGCALGETEALTALEAQAAEATEAEWKGLEPKAARVRRAGAIVLNRRSLPRIETAELEKLALERVAADGLCFLPWDEGGRGESASDELERLRYFASRRPDASKRFGLDPASLDEANLARSAGDWLCPRLKSPGPIIDGQGLARAIAALVPPALRPELEREAPKRIELPSGSSKLIDYGAPGGASVEARAQEFFGLAEQPRICGAPLVLKLLDPGGKPLQVTADLPGFWRGSWAQARKELRGRYPKHEWPEDPASAAPTRSGIKKRR